MRTPDAALAAPPPAPKALRRPAWAKWLWERNIQTRPAGEAIGKSHEWVRLSCLPFDDPRRAVPDEATAARIEAYTQGAVPPESFSPQWRALDDGGGR